MKITSLRSVTVALIALAVTSYPSITQAKPTPTPAPTTAATTGKQAPETADQRLADLKKQVNLTKAQEAKVKPIIEKYVSDRDALSNDKTLSKSDKTKKEALRKQYNQDISAVLTPDQQQKWAAAKKEIFQPKKPVAASPSPSPKK
jgi:Spy/CpxP family protein refolding chaperone